MKKSQAWKKVFAGCLLCAASAITAPAQTFATLVDFDYTNGFSPYYMSPAQGINGNLYGTTAQGGIGGDGTIFEITPAGTFSTVFNFDGDDGDYLLGGLVQGADGKSLYGTTTNGGANYNDGTVFKITAAGKLITLYDFCAQPSCSDGANPIAGLTQSVNEDETFYGTTDNGGANTVGTVFKITGAGSLTILHSFNFTDGANPYAALIQATDGDFYGTTSGGGANGYGTVFKITPSGTLTTIYSFCSQTNCSDGTVPYGGLVQGTDGNFYGTTSTGGGSNDNGTVFRMTPSGVLTTLHSFQSSENDGADPEATLTEATDGQFYGTTRAGGRENGGVIFRISSTGKLANLHSFCLYSEQCTTGTLPIGGLVQATDGTFYGSTYQGGTYNVGTVFSLSTGLGPFVAFTRGAGQVGRSFGILGQGFTGTTSVSLNGTPVPFVVELDTFIEATVPAGAATGYVIVTTPGGALTSNVPFHVVP